MSTLNDLLVEIQTSFEIPMKDDTTLEFKKILSEKLNDYYDSIKKQKQQEILNKYIKYTESQLGASFRTIDDFNYCIEKLIDGLKKVLNLYYEGKSPESYQIFKTTLDEAKLGNLFNRKTSISILNSTDEQRKIIVIDNKKYYYSVLSTWQFIYRKEFEMKQGVDIISIDRISDFTYLSSDEYTKTILILRYLCLFPLAIACSMRATPTKSGYIIPQMLMRYVANDEHTQIVGIRFPLPK